jgi:hypothetical protein
VVRSNLTVFKGVEAKDSWDASGKRQSLGVSDILSGEGDGGKRQRWWGKKDGENRGRKRWREKKRTKGRGKKTREKTTH